MSVMTELKMKSLDLQWVEESARLCQSKYNKYCL